jgi:replicative DNA helicase
MDNDQPLYDDTETTGPSLPHDLTAERALIGAVLVAKYPRQLLRELHLSAADYYHPAHALTHEALEALASAGHLIDAMTVAAHLQQHGKLQRAGGHAYIWGHATGGVTATAAWLADRIRSLALRRQLIHAGSEIAAMGYDPAGDTAELAEHAVTLTRSVRDAGRAVDDSPVQDMVDFLAVDDTAHDWVIPGLLEHGDRVIWTGGEGGGKSFLQRQLAVATAAGAMPFGYEANALGPKRVLVLDCENSERQTRRHYRDLFSRAATRRTPVKPGQIAVDVRPEGVDLTRPEGRAWLMRRVEAVMPDLLVIGPIYRLHAGDPNSEEHARKVTLALDEARSIANCAISLEAHSAKANAMGGPRNLAPVGSSLWLRWPEFGLGLRPVEDEVSADLYRCRRVISWRGARDERQWPKFLREGEHTTWPWKPYAPIDADHNGNSPTGANG